MPKFKEDKPVVRKSSTATKKQSEAKKNHLKSTIRIGTVESIMDPDSFLSQHGFQQHLHALEREHKRVESLMRIELNVHLRNANNLEDIMDGITSPNLNTSLAFRQ
jgi:hypothetical protein